MQIILKFQIVPVTTCLDKNTDICKDILISIWSACVRAS
jgi:hypothetical protein